MTAIYDSVFAGEYFVDPPAGQAIMVALQTVQQRNGAQRAQCLDDFRATRMLGLTAAGHQ